MGADFLLACLPVEVGGHVIKARWKNYSKDKFAQDVYEVTMDAEADLDRWWQKIDDFLPCITGDDYRRDMDWLFLDGKEYVVSGGMSWGEMPTEAFDLLNLLNQMQITYAEAPAWQR
jgi:hypothetical protein